MYEDVSELLGLERFRVVGVRERGDWLELALELPREEAACPHCGVIGAVVKERPVVRVRDLSIAGRRTLLAWRKRRFQCRCCGRCFSERDPALPPRQRVSARFRAELGLRARSGGAHAELARLERTSRYQVGRALALEAVPLRAGRAPGRRLALDEASHRRGPGRLVTVVSDPKRRCVLEVLPGRGQRLLERYLAALPEEQRAGIEVVSIDPSPAFRAAVRSCLPAARIVVDPFHLVRGANEALDRVRRQRRALRLRSLPRGGSRAERGRTFGARRRLLKGRERLRPEERRELSALFESEPLLAVAWGLKEAFRSIYQASDRDEAERRLERFLAWSAREELASFHRFAAQVERWREELLAYFDEPATNGYAEGVTNKIKTIKRRAYGLPSFASFRERILIACAPAQSLPA
jgi:transposase